MGLEAKKLPILPLQPIMGFEAKKITYIAPTLHPCPLSIILFISYNPMRE